MRNSRSVLRPNVLALLAALAAVVLAPAQALGATGSLTQLAGPAGCVEAALGTDGCVTGTALDEASGVATSPDGRNVYLASLNSSAVAIFARNVQTGATTQLAGTAGCIQETGGADPCAVGRGLGAARDVIVSSDGKFVYVAGEDGAIAVFTRDAGTGALTQLAGSAGCVEAASGTDGCAVAGPLNEVRRIVISPDGKNLYAAVPTTPSATSVGTVVSFSRSPATGQITQLAGTAGCVQGFGGTDPCTAGRAMHEADGVSISPDGRFVYVAASEGNATTLDGGVDTFARDAATGALTQLSGAAGCANKTGTDESATAGTCALAVGLHDADGTAMSPDGRSLYIASQGTSSGNSGSVSAFSRDPATGVLTQLAGVAGCASFDGSDGSGGPTGQCAVARLMTEPSAVAVSGDGQSVYVASSDAPGGLAIFARNTATGAISQPAGTDGCVSVGGADTAPPATPGTTCGVARAVLGANDVTVSPDSETVYVAAQDVHALAAFERTDRPPTCVSGSATIRTDRRPTSVTLTCSDQFGAPLTRAIVAGPHHASLSGLNAPIAGGLQPFSDSVSVTPRSGYVGLDSFTFQATDGSETSNVATFTLTIAPPPTVTSLRINPKSFRSRRTPKHHKTGTKVSYRDTQATTATFTVLRGAAGVRRKGRCVAPPRHKARGHVSRCVRYLKVGTFTRRDSTGVNRFSFSGRVRGSALAPGNYRLQVVARNSAGVRSSSATASFVVIK